MSTPVFNARQGLNAVCKGAKYKGKFIKHTEDEYNLLEWLDIREKPSWLEVEQAALINLRKSICDNINRRTDEAILKKFRTGISPETPITATLVWQFDTLNIYLQRESGLIKFPYNLHVGSDDKAKPVYIELKDAKALEILYLEMFGFINKWLASGRNEKEKLQDMTRTGLEEFRDNRK